MLIIIAILMAVKLLGCYYVSYTIAMGILAKALRNGETSAPDVCMLALVLLIALAMTVAVGYEAATTLV